MEFTFTVFAWYDEEEEEGGHWYRETMAYDYKFKRGDKIDKHSCFYEIVTIKADNIETAKEIMYDYCLNI